MRYFLFPTVALIAALVCIPCKPAFSQSTQAPDVTPLYQEAARLYKRGQDELALAKVEAALKQNPQDARSRFLKGLILTEQGKPNDAIQVFQSLTEDFPELPEPYNNLAVLYAAEGEYDKARAALEMAIQTHPKFAVAEENLGDIYAKLAAQAYDKAAQLDKKNTTAPAKLKLIQQLFSNNTMPASDSINAGAANH